MVGVQPGFTKAAGVEIVSREALAVADHVSA